MAFLTILIIMLIVDGYSFKGIRMLTKNLIGKWRKTIYIIFWSSTVIVVFAMITGYFFRSTTRNPTVFTWYYYIFGLFLIFYIPKMLFGVFHLIEDIVQLFYFIIHKHTPKKNNPSNNCGEPISRIKFISQTGLILAFIPFFSFIWGIAYGRFNFQVEHVDLAFNKLPKSFDGLKIVNIADIHIGSLQGFKGQVEDAIKIINAQKPDLILFSGDLVNNFYEELDGWIPILSKMEAKYGKYSILGNHDYGHYYHWESQKEMEENFRKIQEAHSLIGFKLLNNSSAVLERKGEKIAIIGVENWGLPPFPQPGDYDIAVKGVENIPFKILLSHDPNHWEEKIKGKTDVSLTLSGHTHGMQFGIQLGNIRWSPAQYKYDRWAGLYKEGAQYLYINRGLGYIGYPGRVGMPPEITVITLHSN